jgi:elongation factor Ts
MASTMELIKQLRERTGAGMMDVRNALTEANGDMDKALELLRQKGAALAEKKANRATGEGKVAARVNTDYSLAAMVEVNCETDFSANNDRFTALVDASVEAVLALPNPCLDSLMATPCEGATLKDKYSDTVVAVKENMTLSRFVRVEAAANGLVLPYIHGNGKLGVVVEATVADATHRTDEHLLVALKDVAMQIAAFAPDFLRRDDVPADVVANETRIEMGKDDLASKPEAMREKIVAGRVEKSLAQRVLLLQAFVKDPGKTVEQYLNDTAQAVGTTLTLVRMERFLLGEHAASLTPDEPQACSV